MSQRKQYILCLLFFVAFFQIQGVKGENYYVSDIMNCITKVNCINEYKLCAADQTCSTIINAQSGCRVAAQCNLNSNLLWDPNCYINCIQTASSDYYTSLTTCSRQKCHASAQLLKPAFIMILVFLALISFI